MNKTGLSAYTLFNFTPKWEFFEDKILNGFKPRFVLEDFKSFNFNAKFAFPMVCFCDILMSQLQSHMLEYGDYGIGLTKEWGKRNGLNPILYISSNDSTLLRHVKDAKNDINKLKLCSDCANSSDIDKVSFSINSLIRYLKPYEGMQNGKERIFYDEKEWRYLHNEKKLFFLKEDLFNDVDKREEKNKEIAKSLTFKADDIRYFIVKQKDDVTKLINLLENKFPSESKYLSTRIITKNDIEKDF